jgi:hypothetical protein
MLATGSNMITTAPHPVGSRAALRAMAAGILALIALRQPLFVGVPSIDGATDDGREILAVAGALLAVVAVRLWTKTSRVLWSAAALHVLMTFIDRAVPIERDPASEVLGADDQGALPRAARVPDRPARRPEGDGCSVPGSRALVQRRPPTHPKRGLRRWATSSGAKRRRRRRG